METIIFLLNHILTYCITVDLGNIVLKCKYLALSNYSIQNPYYLHRTDMYWENQPELPRDKGSN